MKLQQKYSFQAFIAIKDKNKLSSSQTGHSSYSCHAILIILGVTPHAILNIPGVTAHLNVFTPLQGLILVLVQRPVLVGVRHCHHKTWFLLNRPTSGSSEG